MVNTKRARSSGKGESSGKSAKKQDGHGRKTKVFYDYARMYPSVRSDVRMKENRTYSPPGPGVLLLGTGTTDVPHAAGALPANNQNVWCLNAGITASALNTGRIGRRYKITAVQLRGHGNTGSFTPAFQHVRISLVWDRKPTAANLPGYADIFDTASSVALTKVTSAPRFKVLRTWVQEMSSVASNNEDVQFAFDEYVTLKNKETVMLSNTASGYYSEMVEGALLLVACSGGASTGAGTAPGVYMNWRIYFDE